MVTGMTEPVANVDIEDVLSSIRRLVSGGQDKESETPEEAREDERLVLTPSQRVDAADKVTDAGVTRAHAPEFEETEDAKDEAESEFDTVDGIGADDDDDDEEIAANADLPEERDDQSAIVSEVLAELGDSGDRDTEAGLEVEAEGETESDDTALDDIAAMFMRHGSASSTTWEPDGDDEDAFAKGAVTPALDWRDVGESDEDDREPDILGGEHRGETGQRAQERAREFDGDAWEDEDVAFAIENEAVLDEDALRDLVAEIVREELMGSLGERITRNVRKLVRREIHRALNSQDFE